MTGNAGQTTLSFEGIILKAEGKDSAWVKIPQGVMAAFSQARLPVPVLAAFDGEPYEGWLLKGEDGTFSIIINKSIRKKLASRRVTGCR